MSKKSRIKHAIFENINSQRKYGESKHEAHKESQRITRETGERQYTKGIFAYATEDTYKKQSITFENWVLKKRPDIRTLDDAKKYVGEFLLENMERGLSANTVHTRAYALASAFKCNVKEFGVDLPPRKSADAKHSNYLRSDGCKKVFPDRLIPEKEPLHQHRKDYAHLLYNEVIRNGEHLIIDRGLYRCRGKNYGKAYNRTALAIVSKNLGHGQNHELPHEVKREGIVTNHYIW